MRAWTLALLVGLGCAPHGEPGPAFWLVPGAQELGLRRSICYGTCPVYTVVVEADGAVWYHGVQFVEHEGVRTGSLPRPLVHAVFLRARSSGYMSSDAAYEAAETDNATAYSGVLMGRWHAVTNYGDAAPAAVAELERAIDVLVALTRWDEVPALAPAVGSCDELRVAIALRCKGEDPPGECVHFKALEIAVGNDRYAYEVSRLPSAEGHFDERCARHLRSFERVAAASASP